jgi:hypothetical protein
MKLSIFDGFPPTGTSLVYALSTPRRKMGFKKGCIYQKSKDIDILTWMARPLSIPESAGNWPG